MKKYNLLSMVLILGLSISSIAQTKECQSQERDKNATTINKSIADSQTISKSIQIKPYKYNPISLNGPRIIVIDGKVSKQGFAGVEPNVIRSLSVIKGEKATSLYGNKNGSAVIIITTKKGAAKVEQEVNKK